MFSIFKITTGISKSLVYSLELLRWKIKEWGIENKCKYYDLSGVEINNNDPKKLGIYRNKKKWGGKLVAYSSWFN